MASWKSKVLLRVPLFRNAQWSYFLLDGGHIIGSMHALQMLRVHMWCSLILYVCQIDVLYSLHYGTCVCLRAMRNAISTGTSLNPNCQYHVRHLLKLRPPISTRRSEAGLSLLVDIETSEHETCMKTFILYIPTISM